MLPIQPSSKPKPRACGASSLGSTVGVRSDECGYAKWAYADVRLCQMGLRYLLAARLEPKQCPEASLAGGWGLMKYLITTLPCLEASLAGGWGLWLVMYLTPYYQNTMPRGQSCWRLGLDEVHYYYLTMPRGQTCWRLGLVIPYYHHTMPRGPSCFRLLN